MSYSLALTLGHNSSAILIKDGNILNGYENERLTGIKADSAFPINAINELDKYHDLREVSDVYISHWSTFSDIDEMNYKHWRKDLLLIQCPKAKIHSHIPGFSHHDAHVESLRSFTFPNSLEWEIVIDGFGNFNETISIYHNQKLIHRCFGFDSSLGLLYQYTTAFLCLKMNIDEFKLLGYEAHIKEVCDYNKILEIKKAAHTYAKKYTKRILTPSIIPEFDLVAGLEALPNIRLKVRDYNNYVVFAKLGFRKKTMSNWEKRVVVAFFLQSTVEEVISNIVRFYGMKRVALTGGFFMNVKVNNVVASLVEKISIMPICGDQSCGLGVYNYYKKDLVWPDHLFWGKRDLSSFPVNEPRTFIAPTLNSAIDQIITQLHTDKIVNFVYGNCEFGARALGHTTTFALPTKENVEYINMLNEREATMPMAPMVAEDYMWWYNDDDKVIKSLEYMIITLNLGVRPDPTMIGVVHNHPYNDTFTSRPQIIRYEHFLWRVLERFGVIINTSFNVHGQPIVLTIEQILVAHRFQRERDYNEIMITIIFKEEE